MTYLSTENLGKKYGLKLLFEDLTFGISKGDKTALIAQNGVGKSTFLKSIAGLNNSFKVLPFKIKSKLTKVCEI